MALRSSVERGSWYSVFFLCSFLRSSGASLWANSMWASRLRLFVFTGIFFDLFVFVLRLVVLVRGVERRCACCCLSHVVTSGDMQLRMAHVKIRKVVTAAIMDAFRLVRWDAPRVFTLMVLSPALVMTLPIKEESDVLDADLGMASLVLHMMIII